MLGCSMFLYFFLSQLFHEGRVLCNDISKESVRTYCGNVCRGVSESVILLTTLPEKKKVNKKKKKDKIIATCTTASQTNKSPTIAWSSFVNCFWNITEEVLRTKNPNKNFIA
jgi:hypothetical protein